MRERKSQQILLKDDRESEQNRYSLLTVRDAEHAMFVFSIFAVVIIIGIFSFELLIRGSGILKSLGVVLGNVSSVLSGSTLLTIFEEGINLMFFRRAREERARLKEEKRRNILGEVMAGKYTDIDTLLDKVNNLIESEQITVSNDSILPSPMHCLQWGLTYKIYDCLYEHGSLTPVEIDSLIRYGDPDTVTHALERMGDIGITKPVNLENLTRDDLPSKGFDILPILHKKKKWELTEYIRG